MQEFGEPTPYQNSLMPGFLIVAQPYVSPLFWQNAMVSTRMPSTGTLFAHNLNPAQSLSSAMPMYKLRCQQHFSGDVDGRAIVGRMQEYHERLKLAEPRLTEDLFELVVAKTQLASNNARDKMQSANMGER